jgi:uncharacterized protein YjbJ (UPF0337 family)
MNNEVKGKAENLKGRVKQAAGAVTGDKELEAEGAGERATGAAKEMAGKAKRKLDEAVASVREDDEDVEEREAAREAAVQGPGGNRSGNA